MTRIVAAVLSAIQVYVKGSDKLEQHQAAAARYDCLRRELEARLPAPPIGPDWHTFEADFRSRWQAVTDKAPPYPQRMLDAAEQHMKRRVPFEFCNTKRVPQART
jgi:hypothetical protein